MKSCSGGAEFSAIAPDIVTIFLNCDLGSVCNGYLPDDDSTRFRNQYADPQIQLEKNMNVISRFSSVSCVFNFLNKATVIFSTNHFVSVCHWLILTLPHNQLTLNTLVSCNVI